VVGGGDLTLAHAGLARTAIQYTDLHHNDANALGTAILTPQDQLYALNRLAREARAAGIRTASQRTANRSAD
jgi:hypothetical protein